MFVVHLVGIVSWLLRATPQEAWPVNDVLLSIGFEMAIKMCCIFVGKYINVQGVFFLCGGRGGGEHVWQLLDARGLWKVYSTIIVRAAKSVSMSRVWSPGL